MPAVAKVITFRRTRRLLPAKPDQSARPRSFLNLDLTNSKQIWWKKLINELTEQIQKHKLQNQTSSELESDLLQSYQYLNVYFSYA